jgi:hypothetical protein
VPEENRGAGIDTLPLQIGTAARVPYLMRVKGLKRGSNVFGALAASYFPYRYLRALY